MGILRNGYYTRGYKTSTEIDALTNMKVGDSVFDTTNSFRRIYDGFNWVSSNQVSLTTNGIPGAGNQLNGSVSRVTTTNDLTIESAISPTNNSNVIGVVQTPKVGGIPVGTKAVLQFSNIGAGQTNGTVVRGRWIIISTVYGRFDDVTSPLPVGVFGVALKTTSVVGDECPIFIRPINTYT
jgi:hypothetical protein